MRIISQDGTIDVNYDSAIVACDNKKRPDKGWGIGAVSQNKSINLATYSTEEQALEVMKEIRTQYSNRETITGNLVNGETYTNLLNEVFQMPQDEGKKCEIKPYIETEDLGGF